MLTCQRRRRPAADRRSPGARRPRRTRTGREGEAGGGARPARTSGGGGGRGLAAGRRRLLPVSGPKMSQPRDSGAPTLLPVRMRTHSSRFRDSAEVPPPRPRARALTRRACRLAPGARKTLASRRRGAPIGRARARPAPRASRPFRARTLAAAPVIGAGAHATTPRSRSRPARRTLPGGPRPAPGRHPLCPLRPKEPAPPRDQDPCPRHPSDPRPLTPDSDPPPLVTPDSDPRPPLHPG